MTLPETSARDCPIVCHITAHAAVDGRVFHRECLALAEAGYEVHLVARHARDEVLRGVRIHGLPKPASRLDRMLVWPWRAYRRALAIRPRPLLFHLHDPVLLPVGMMLRLHGPRVIYDVHENVPESILSRDYLPKPLRRAVSLAYRFLEGITTSRMGTVHVLDSIARRYRQPRAVVRNLPKLSVVPSGSLRPVRDRPRLIYVGGISRVRGALTMVELARELARRDVDFELRMVGHFVWPGLEEEMRRAISGAGLGGRVTLVPFIPFEQAQAEVAAADVGLCLLHPIPNYLNSLAVKILEYMRFGLPVIASDFACWREYVTDTGAGIQVDVRDVAGIADAVQGLLADPERMRRMGECGRQAVLTRYCWEREKDVLLEFYRRLLDGSPGRHALTNRSG